MTRIVRALQGATALVAITLTASCAAPAPVDLELDDSVSSTVGPFDLPTRLDWNADASGFDIIFQDSMLTQCSFGQDVATEVIDSHNVVVRISGTNQQNTCLTSSKSIEVEALLPDDSGVEVPVFVNVEFTDIGKGSELTLD